MEISPIPGIRALPAVKAPPMDSALSAVFDIENFARIGDETYSPSDGKSAGGGEDEFDDPLNDESDEFTAQEATEDSSATAPEIAPGRPISFFA
jgi:hypothetical protein